uniref:C-reactive protein n=1 Tax=Salvator merianae TaxID=96440 RepID=A0A8D0E7M2_SALMN
MAGKEKHFYGYKGDFPRSALTGIFTFSSQLKSKLRQSHSPVPCTKEVARINRNRFNVRFDFSSHFVLQSTSMFSPFLLILASLAGSLAQEDLRSKAFIFPAASSTAAVVVKAQPLHPLTSFTVCLKAYTVLTRACGLFSYATKASDNELLIFKPKPNLYSLYVGGASVTFSLPEARPPKPYWEHICMSWESATGIVELWLNGQPLPRLGLKKGYSISPEAFIVLGQDQDTVGGGFVSNQSFVGELTDVYMWSRVLTPDEVGLVVSDRMLSDHLVNWRSLNYEIKGYVVLKPSLISKF